MLFGYLNVCLLVVYSCGNLPLVTTLDFETIWNGILFAFTKWKFSYNPKCQKINEGKTKLNEKPQQRSKAGPDGGLYLLIDIAMVKHTSQQKNVLYRYLYLN